MQDPFRERPTRVLRRRMTLLGGVFEFQADSARLLHLVDAAYEGLPAHRLVRTPPKFQVRMTVRKGAARFAGGEPPQLATQAGAGLICATVDADNYVALYPEAGRGLISFSRAMLAYPYHARYELLEFAVFTLASRAQGLVPLHAACVGVNGRALLLIGESGAGKSTLTVQCMQQGLELLAEDAVFIEPASLRATGVPNFLHLRADALRFIDSAAIATHVRRSPVIERRSGVRKFEVDVRHRSYRLAREVMNVVGIVFVSSRTVAGGATLMPVDASRARKRLLASQAYASGLPSWKAFSAQLPRLAAFELGRGGHPREGAEALSRLLNWGGRHR